MNSTVISALIVASGISATLHSSAGEAPQSPSNVRDAFFSNHTIPRLRIQLDDTAIAALRKEMREYAKATVFEGTNVYHDVGIHLKGQYGTFQGIDGKPSLTLNFDKFVKGQRFHGLDKLHLNNSAQDPSYLCEMLGRELFQAAGVPTGRASHATVKMNGRDLGLFVLIEGYDEMFLKRHFGISDGNLYDSEFRHEITDPIRKSRGKGPDDHSDLRALAAAVEDPNHVERITRLSKLLDIDRFYTMVALESLIRHHDGYSIGINNYRVYNGLATGRAIFLPGGMDQLFFEPQASVLPDLKGVVSTALLETQAGRSEFRKRCVTLHSRLFPGLSNQVELARTHILPVLAELDARTVRQCHEAATNLQQRIEARQQHVSKEISAAAYAPAFATGGTVRLTNWIATVEGGGPLMFETNSGAGQTLVVRSRVGEKINARWQSLVHLQPGHYRFSTTVIAAQPIFRGPSPPVGLRVWGLTEVQLEFRRPTHERIELLCGFTVEPGNQGEYLLQCEVKELETNASLRFESVVLTRLE